MGNLKGSFEHYGVFAKIFILLAITLFFLLLFSPIISLITYSNPMNIGMLKLSQLLLTVGVIVMPPFFLAYFISKKPLKYLQLDTRKVNWVDILFVVLFMIVIIPFINLLGDWNHHLVLPNAFSGMENWMKIKEDDAAQLTEKFLKVNTFQGLLLNIFLIAILPAIGEELYFRGALQGIIQQWRGVRTSIWIVAIVFSAIHMQFYGFVPRMLMGAFFGYLLIWSENIWLPIAAHFTNNVMAIIFFYLQFNGYRVPDIDSVGFGNTLWIGLASGSLGIFGFFILKKRFQIQNEKTPDL